MATVALAEISKVYSSRKSEVIAVNKLSLDVADREFVVLVGPSGCGKTTTLRLIAGLERPDAGTIRIGDRVVNDVAPKDRDIAMVFQNYALYPHMTVYNNMGFGLKMRRTPKAEIRRKVHEAAALLGIESLLERKPAALSGGERQRVAVGRAIVRKPQVFLFDEPLSNLDAKLRVHMRTEIKSLHQKLQTTVVYVTHDQEEAMTLGDRIIIMDQGVVRQDGKPLEIYNRPASRFVAGFVGTAPMNFFGGNLKTEGGKVSFLGKGGMQLELPLQIAGSLGSHSAREVVLGMRPEHIRFIEPQTMGASTSRDELRDTVKATVTVVEPLGDRIHVHCFTPADEAFVAQVPATVTVRTGEQRRVTFDLDHAHLFAADETGRRLSGQA